MGPSPLVAAYEQRHSPCSTTDEEQEEDDEFEFEFRPLLPPPRRTERPTRIATRRVAAHQAINKVTTTITDQQPGSSHQQARRAPPPTKVEQPPPVQPRRVRWHHMAFGSVRVPSAMDMGEIRRRLKARHALAAAGSADVGWAPWRLIRSLSCKGVEAVAVAAATAPVRLV